MAYTVLADVKIYLGITSTDYDTVLTALIPQAQAVVDRHTRRTFEGSAADRKFDSHLDVEGPVLWVYSAGDLASIVTVTNGNGDSVASTVYVTEPRNAVARALPIIGLRIKNNSSTWWRPGTAGATEDAITVNGIWAYSATPPADVVLATHAIIDTFFNQRGSGSSSSISEIRMDDVTVKYGGTDSTASSGGVGGIIVTAADLLAPYVREF
jgi:hypothetical protein